MSCQKNPKLTVGLGGTASGILTLSWKTPGNQLTKSEVLNIVVRDHPRPGFAIETRRASRHRLSGVGEVATCPSGGALERVQYRCHIPRSRCPGSRIAGVLTVPSWFVTASRPKP